MKKKIILILSFLMVVIFLTACSSTADEGFLKDTEQIAYNTAFKDNYQFPEDYHVSYAENINNRITITNESGVSATYQIVDKQVELQSVTISYTTEIILTILIEAFCLF